MKPDIVINTGPILSIIAATGRLEVLGQLFNSVYVPKEVVDELTVSNAAKFGANEFVQSNFLIKEENLLEIKPMLLNSLDLGEASVIQLAINKKIDTVSIDEAVGRRIARLNDLKLIGSLGILIKAKQNGLISSMKDCIHRMREQGIYISDELITTALKITGEK